jgi:hypothetical protein
LGFNGVLVFGDEDFGVDLEGGKNVFWVEGIEFSLG